MIDHSGDMSRRNAAIIAGVSLILMAIAAGFSVGFVLDSLVVPGDAAATANAIKASETLFRAGIFGWLVILILDVIVAWALHAVLEQVNKSLSLLTAWLRLAYAAILGVGLLAFVLVLLLVSGANYLNVFDTDQQHALVLLLLDGFNGIWSTIGLVVFGCHLAMLGVLVFKSDDIPRIVGVVLIIAACGYLTTSLATLLVPTYTNVITIIESVFIAPMIIGELWLAVWLLIKGGKNQNRPANLAEPKIARQHI